MSDNVLDCAACQRWIVSFIASGPSRRKVEGAQPNVARNSRLKCEMSEKPLSVATVVIVLSELASNQRP